MRILIIHYRYSIIGGPERYLFNIKQALEDKGHEVIPFSVSYPENEPSKYDSYFVKALDSEFHLHKSSKVPLKSIRIANDMIYNRAAYKAVHKLIDDTNPDIAYVLIYKGKLTYSVINACHKMNIPVIFRVSSFSHFCGKATFYRNGEVCDLCITKPTSIIKYKCVHGSLPFSTLYYSMNKIERWSGSMKKIKEIICPSSFTADIFRRDKQFKNVKITHLPTFQDITDFKLTDDIIEKRFNTRQICYTGRITEEKGLEVLIDAIGITNNSGNQIRFVIAGFTSTKYSQYIQSLIKEKGLEEVVVCEEFLTKEETFKVIKTSMFSVVPSIWYDNMPNSLIESQSFGVPTYATDIGSLKEMVNHGYNGYLFKYKDSSDLANAITNSLALSKQKYKEICVNALDWVHDHCSKDKHISTLEGIFKKYLN